MSGHREGPGCVVAGTDSNHASIEAPHLLPMLALTGPWQLGWVVQAVNGADVLWATAGEVDAMLRNLQRPITLTFAAEDVVALHLSLRESELVGVEHGANHAVGMRQNQQSERKKTKKKQAGCFCR